MEPGRSDLQGIHDNNSLFVESEDDSHKHSADPKVRHVPEPDEHGDQSNRDAETIKHFKSSEGFSYRPTLAVYHPSFEKAQELIFEICENFSKVYKECTDNLSYTNKVIDNICSELKEYSKASKKFKHVGPIACLGPSGVGKSSTINAILGAKSAALETDGHATGTYVVHEYKKAHKKQLHQYSVDIRFHSEDTIANLVQKHFGALEKFRSDPTELGPGEEEDLDKKYHAAVDFFTSMLCEQDGFADSEADDYYFAKGDLDIEKLHSLITSFQKDNEYHDIQHLSETHNGADLVKAFRKYSRPGKRSADKQSHSPWAIVDKVIVRQNIDLLNAGVVLHDAPGLKDADLTVTENTERCLNNAGAVLVFANMKRLTSNVDLDDMLRKCVTRGFEQRVYLIVTSIDLKQKLGELELVDLNPEQLAQLRNVQISKERSYRDIKNLQEEKRRLHDTDLLAFRTIDNKLRAAEADFEKNKASEKQLSVQFTCDAAARILREKLRKITQSSNAPDLPIHFVSNVEYQKHVHGSDDLEPPLLDVKSTGIPDLCRRLYTIQADDKFHVLRTICCKLIPSILRAVDGILDKTPVERVEMLKEQVIYRAQLMNNLIFTNLEASIQQNFKEFIIGAHVAHGSEWTKRGAHLVESWSKECKLQTFRAFCRRGGVWQLPQNRGRRVWNAVLREVADKDLMTGFRKFEAAVEQDRRSFTSELRDNADRFCESVSQCEASHGVNMDAFYDFVRETQYKLELAMHRVFANLERQIGVVRSKCVISNDESYLAAAMEPAYDDCVALALGMKEGVKFAAAKQGYRKKLNSPKYQTYVGLMQKHITGAIDGEDVFLKAILQAREELLTSLGKDVASLSKGVWKKCQAQILDDFENRFGHVDDDTENNPEAVALLKEAANKAKEAINGPLKHLIEECRTYEEQGSKSNETLH